MTSIIILTQNRLEQTKKCIKSIRKHTTEAHEIIFVDNGSTDDTVKWLQGQIKEHKNYRLIENKENIGFTKGINQGINLCRGEYILLLDNDVVVSPGWLSGMLACLKHAPEAGIVGPMTNKAKGIQQIVDENYRTVEYLDKYAVAFREKHHHRRIPYRNLSGFCMLFKRTLIEKIGLFDECFASGDFADEDFCMRAALEGYSNYIAGDVFIHQYGGRSLFGNKVEDRAVFSVNSKIFTRKWMLDYQSEEGKKLALIKITELASDLYQRGKLEQAIEALITCIEIIPDDYHIYYNMVRILLESKSFSEAWEVFESMPDNVKNNIKGLEGAGYAKEGLGLDDEASDYADRMLAMDEGYAPALNLWGVLAYKKDDKDKAAAYFLRAIDADPSYGEAHTNLGVLYWGMDRRDKAPIYLRKGLVLSPSIPDAGSLYYSAASSLDLLGEAETDFRDAACLYPNHKKLGFLYIDVLIQQGKLDSAMGRIEDALALYGLDEGIINAALAVREKIGPRHIETKTKKGSLALCMIVKNEERHLVRCLSSVKQVVDEIIIVDTGSTDKTIDIAKVFGARVFEYPWAGDFSAARNESLARAEGDWIFVLDADEVISPLDHMCLLQTITGCGRRSIAFDFITRNYGGLSGTSEWTENDGSYPQEEKGRGWVGSNKVRLFRNDSHIQFENPVHELVEPALIRYGISIERCQIPVHHYGRLDPEKLVEKGEAYYLLGRRKLEERGGDDYKALKELAIQAGEIGRYEEAIDLWHKALALRPDGVEVLKALKNLSFNCIMVGQYKEALNASKKAFELSPVTTDGLLNYALCEMLTGNVKKTKVVIEENVTRVGDSLNLLIKALLAASCLIDGDQDQGIRIFEELARKKLDPAAYIYSLLERLADSGQFDYFKKLVDAVLSGRLADHATLRGCLAPMLNKIAVQFNAADNRAAAQRIIALAYAAAMDNEETVHLRGTLL